MNTNTVVITVEGLSKTYKIGTQRAKYRTLRDVIAESSRAPLRLLRRVTGRGGEGRPQHTTFRALNNVCFQVKKGEVVGIIGRNGAGKSTLLKVLSRITEPTSGYAEIQGRLSSLLEVGTGFHQELTGRENIFLNAAILGMRKVEIDRRFDEIVAFSEVEQFIDTPVKHYSSGMYLRLAFAVAAHLDTEILLVDEVLAVGDLQFQKKCLGKMEEVAQEGRTVLFVSHNMSAVNTLCRSGILLAGGQIACQGDIASVIHEYQTSIQKEGASDIIPNKPGGIAFGQIAINGKSVSTVDSSAPFDVRIPVAAGKEVPRYVLFCTIQDSSNNLIVHSLADEKVLQKKIEPGTHHVNLHFPPLWLKPGVYTLQFKLIDDSGSSRQRYLSDPFMLEVEGEIAPGQGLGVLTPPMQWETTF